MVQRKPIARKVYLDQIRALEVTVGEQAGRIQELEASVAVTGVEVQSMTRASMEVREEDVEQLADYKRTNTKLIKFVEKVAESKSKFGKEARALLGI